MPPATTSTGTARTAPARFGRDVAGTRIGVARGVKKALIGKVIGKDGADTLAVAEAIQWALNEDANIISMSLGFDFPDYQRELEEGGLPADIATSRALDGYRRNVALFEQLAGMVERRADLTGVPAIVIAAAGNESRADEDPRFKIAVSPPAIADGFISVAALGEASGRYFVAPFSNTGALVAGPGVDITSAKRGGGLAVDSGTSMAAPHVAGVAALWAEMLSATGGQNPRVLTARLVGFGRPPTDCRPASSPRMSGAGWSRRRNKGARVRQITFELLRHGKPNNQLRRPTNDLALCENHAAVSLQVPFEHNQLLHRLQALNYQLGPEPRAFQLKDTAEVLGDLLGSVPGLIAELNREPPEAAHTDLHDPRRRQWRRGRGAPDSRPSGDSGVRAGLAPVRAGDDAERLPWCGTALAPAAAGADCLTREVRGAWPIRFRNGQGIRGCLSSAPRLAIWRQFRRTRTSRRFAGFWSRGSPTRTPTTSALATWGASRRAAERKLRGRRAPVRGRRVLPRPHPGPRGARPGRFRRSIRHRAARSGPPWLLSQTSSAASGWRPSSAPQRGAARRWLARWS